MDVYYGQDIQEFSLRDSERSRQVGSNLYDDSNRSRMQHPITLYTDLAHYIRHQIGGTEKYRHTENIVASSMALGLSDVLFVGRT